uniref:C2 domain-containing protein n=1 Tax=Terrapene triunguis TaxID=2587831 RepID=A0A674J457_9SAUR
MFKCRPERGFILWCPKELGLFVDFNPEAMLLDIEDGGGDEDLEAELAALTGEKVTEGKSKPKGKTPLPMDHIEKMAAECMKDLNEEKEEDEGLEEDTDLLVCTYCQWNSVFHGVSSVSNKTLETMLAAMKKGKKINEEEMPPPVASGRSSANMPQTTGAVPESLGDPTKVIPKEKVESSADHELHTRTLLVTRQTEYKLAALKAKQQGDLEKAKEYMKTGKKFTMVLEALDSGQPVDLQDMPPAPQAGTCSEVLIMWHFVVYIILVSAQQPKTVLEALQQRLEKYRSAAAQAKASGDDRKGRMHERIAKQYQDAIRTHKAGRKVNFAELPVPPGFPPIPGVTPTDGDSTIAAVLESANHLANMEEKEDEDEEVENEHGALTWLCQISVLYSCSFSASEQLEFLENRKKQYLKAAIKAKQQNDLEQAKLYLRTAKNLDPKIELAKSGKSVDISKLPSPPTDDESDFIFIHHEDVKLSQKAEEVYTQLIKLLKDQHEKCLQYSRQFMHLGNITETARFEKLAQGCKKDLEILQLAQAQGMDPPSHHFEERTFKIIRIFSELNSTEMHLIIVRGINLPAPPGVTPNDLDAFVKFEFQYPNTEQAQKSKTAVIKNTNSPEYDQLFKLTINRNHRGFRRVIQTKGIKFEIFHKGGLFRSDKQVGTAHLKLDKLESECEIREIIEILDGRKPTGGKLEVKVRLREPLSGQDLQTITENWLILEH